MKKLRFQINCFKFRTSKYHGFTLVEILIVVTILGIMAAIMIPKFSNATEETRENMMKEELRMLRTQIATYRAQHWDTCPGYDDGGNISEQSFIDQLTLFTDENGNTNAVAGPVFKYGPYLREIPENPLNNKSSIRMIPDGGAMPGAGTDVDGWIFKPEENILRSDSPGTDKYGVSYFSY